MNAVRQLELEASLRRELNRHAQERHLSSTGRVVWLLDQVENYVKRWLGLRAACVQSVAPPTDDLFRMIEIGAEAISAELQGLESPAIAESWQGFLAVLAAIRVGSDPLPPPQLAESLAVVRSALGSLVQ